MEGRRVSSHSKRSEDLSTGIMLNGARRCAFIPLSARFPDPGQKSNLKQKQKLTWTPPLLGGTPPYHTPLSLQALVTLTNYSTVHTHYLTTVWLIS